MSFNPNIPQASDNTQQSAPQLRANFRAIAAAWGENHRALTSNEAQGEHELIGFSPQVADPDTSSSQVALYNKIVSSIPTLFFAPSSSQTPITMTYPSIVNTGDQQYTFCAGPFIIYGGIIKNPTSGQVVNLSPGSSLIYIGLNMANLKSNVVESKTQVIPTSVSGTSFTITFQSPTSPTLDVYYFGIGLP